MAEQEETRFSGNLSFPTCHGHERWHWLSRESSAASLMQVFDVSLPWIRADDACLVHTNPIPHHEHCFLSFFLFISHLLCLDSLVVIVLDCPRYLLTATSNCAACGAQIGDLINRLVR